MDNTNFNTIKNNKQHKGMFKHFTSRDRIILEHWLILKNSKSYTGDKITLEFIARKIGVSKSAVSREIKRGLFREVTPNGKVVEVYRSARGDANAKEAAKRSHYRTKLEKGSPELKYIETILRQGGDIVTAMVYYENSTNTPFPVCEKTIYNYYRKKMLKGIKPYRRIEKKEKVAKMAQKGKNISERPFEPTDRSEFGHWEGDLIVGARGSKSDCLLTLIERQTRFYYTIKIPSKHMTSVVEGLNKIERKLGLANFQTIFKTITFDNGTEFRDYENMELSTNHKEIRTQVYFANPYHSWERGSNERGNRLMRKYFPKGTDFSKVDNEDIFVALSKINFQVRKKLNYQSPMSMIKKFENRISSIFEKFKFKNLFCNFNYA